jgi:hypothetical protein
MEFDYIIACGDSFTEGCKNTLDICIQDTWPGQLGRALEVPWVNLAEGGASNLDIALQPIQHFTTQTPPKKPLFIFGFTVDHRPTFYNYKTGKISSFYTTLPEQIDQHEGLVHMERVQLRTQIKLGMLPVDEYVDTYQLQTIRAIEIANNYKKLYADATVMWGFIHSYLPEENIKVKDLHTTRPTEYDHMDTCFNTHLEGCVPLQSITHDKKYWVSKYDCHPNRNGIRKYMKFFKQILDK